MPQQAFSASTFRVCRRQQGKFVVGDEHRRMWRMRRSARPGKLLNSGSGLNPFCGLMSIPTQAIVVILFLAGYLLSPLMLTWGWLRWSVRPKLRTASAILSLLGLIFATASALLAVSAIAYSLMIGGFPYYDPRLMKIFAIGALLSLCGIIFGVAGVFRANSLRWHAPISAAATLSFWIVAAVGE